MKTIEEMNKAVRFAVELEDGSMEYVGEFDMTDWNKGWNQALEKATEISDEYGFDTELMRLDPMDFWLQSASNVLHLFNRLQKKDGDEWFTFEVCIDKDDALEIKDLLDKHTDSYFLKSLLDEYQKWEKL